MVCLNQRVYTWFENRAVSGYTAAEDGPRMRQWLIQERLFVLEIQRSVTDIGRF